MNAVRKMQTQSAIYHCPTGPGTPPKSRYLPRKKTKTEKSGERTRARILDYITEYRAQHGYGPSLRDIGEAVHLLSSSTVHSHLTTLEREGKITRNRAIPRSVDLVDRPGTLAVRLTGTIPQLRALLNALDGQDSPFSEQIWRMLENAH